MCVEEPASSRDVYPFCQQERVKPRILLDHLESNFELSRALEKWNAKAGANRCSWEAS